MLEAFHIRCLQSILGIRWWHRKTHMETRNTANIESIEHLVLQRQLRWLGHVIHMPSNRLPRRLPLQYTSSLTLTDYHKQARLQYTHPQPYLGPTGTNNFYRSTKRMKKQTLKCTDSHSLLSDLHSTLTNNYTRTT